MPKSKATKKAAPKRATATRTNATKSNQSIIRKKASAAKKVVPKKASPPPFISTGFWLLKSEPETYPIEVFAQDKRTLWTGVRNYQARNFMMTSMKPGDRFLFYHSNADPSAATGTGIITRNNQPDPTALDASSPYHDPKASFDHPIWFCAEVEFSSAFKRPVTLADIRAEKDLAAMSLLQRGQRLSVLPITEAEFLKIVEMGTR